MKLISSGTKFALKAQNWHKIKNHRSVLGRCQMAFEQMNNAPRSETIWFSVHEPDETTIDTRHNPV